MANSVPRSHSTSTSSQSDNHLQQGIGLWGLIALAVSIQIGSGWLLATMAAASIAGPAAVLAWILGAAFFGIIGVAWVELGTMLPRSGGGVHYPRLTHGAFVGWFNGWGFLISAIALPVIEAQAVLTYAGGQWPQLGLVEVRDGTTMLSWPTGILSGFVLLFIFFLLNAMGVRLLAESNKIATLWKIAIPVTTIVLMLLAFRGENFTAFGGFAPEGYAAVLGSLSSSGVVFAYVAIRHVIDFGGEARNPQRDLPIAVIVGGLLIPLVIYVLLQFAFVGAIDWAAAGIAPGDWAGLMESKWGSAPLIGAITAAGFGWFAVVLLSDAALSPAAAGWVFLGVAGRTTYSMASTGELPRRLTRINRHGVPSAALLMCTGVGLLMFLPIPSWYQFVGMVSGGLVLGYLLGGPSMSVLRRLAPGLPRPVRIRGGGLWAAAGYVGSVLLIYFSGWTTLVNLLTVVFLALPLFAVNSCLANGWTAKVPSYLLSAVFVVAWFFVASRGGWLMSTTGEQAPGSWSFPVYFGAVCVVVFGFLGALHLLCTSDGQAELRAGAWVSPTLLATLGVSYLGEYGPLTTPVLDNGFDIAVMAAVGLATYKWAVISGKGSAELTEIIEENRAATPAMSS